MTAWLKGNSRINSGRRNERASRAPKRRRRRRRQRAMYINVSVSAAFSLFSLPPCRLISSFAAHVFLPLLPSTCDTPARLGNLRIRSVTRRVRRRSQFIRRCWIRELRLTNLYRCRRGNRKQPLFAVGLVTTFRPPKGTPLWAGNYGKGADRFCRKLSIGSVGLGGNAR